MNEFLKSKNPKCNVSSSEGLRIYTKDFWTEHILQNRRVKNKCSYTEIKTKKKKNTLF